jgi:hypothetical protein
MLPVDLFGPKDAISLGLFFHFKVFHLHLTVAVFTRDPLSS